MESIIIFPLAGLLRPAINSMSIDFPEPEGPNKAKYPSSSSKESGPRLKSPIENSSESIFNLIFSGKSSGI